MGEFRKYSFPALWGVPFAYNKDDLSDAVKKLKTAFEGDNKIDWSIVERLINNNEKIISRCGMLAQFSSITITLFIFISNKQDIIGHGWQRLCLYIIAAIWAMTNIILLWHLKHELPKTEHFGLEDDFNFTANLFFKRMWIYNANIIVAIVSFALMFLLLLPFKAEISSNDYLASPTPKENPTLRQSDQPQEANKTHSNQTDSRANVVNNDAKSKIDSLKLDTSNSSRINNKKHKNHEDRGYRNTE